MLAACRGEPVDRTPVWFMRQAGRCLAAYRKLRERHDILEITRTPELCAQVTTMPVDTFGVDGAVLYADIMLPLYGMGVPFSIDPGVGPIVHRPVRDTAAVESLPNVRRALELVAIGESWLAESSSARTRAPGWRTGRRSRAVAFRSGEENTMAASFRPDFRTRRISNSACARRSWSPRSSNRRSSRPCWPRPTGS